MKSYLCGFCMWLALTTFTTGVEPAPQTKLSPQSPVVEKSSVEPVKIELAKAKTNTQVQTELIKTEPVKKVEETKIVSSRNRPVQKRPQKTDNTVKVSKNGQIEVTGFGLNESVKAEQIGIEGPSECEPKQEVVFRLTGTPTVDLNKALMEQLDWLLGDDRMYCYLLSPGQDKKSLDVRAELVISMNGATLQPLLRVSDSNGLTVGEHRVIIDWNYGQNQLVEHHFTVKKNDGDDDDNDEDDDEVDPPVPPIPPVSDLRLVLMIEIDNQMEGEIGVKLFEHLEAVKDYLITTKVDWMPLDNSEKEWQDYAVLLENISPPAILIVDKTNNTCIQAITFGTSADKTIAKLAELGIK